MGPLNSTLFRVEVMRSRADRLHGDVTIATPLSWQVIGFLLIAGLVVATIFFATATYARVEVVTGLVTLDKGVASIVPSRPGVVTAIAVDEGESVSAGQTLARIRAEEDMAGGTTVSDRVRRSLDEQDARLATQGELLLAAASAEQARLRGQIEGLRAEIASLDDQIEDQRQLVQVALKEAADLETVATRGFISRRDLEARQSVLLSRRQQLAQLRQAQGAKRAEMAEAERAAEQARATAQAQYARAQSERAALATEVAQADLARGYTIKSPVRGIATAITARPGQPVRADRQLMMVVPTDAVPRVELYVPTTAAGFLQPRQEVRIAVDAFPYQRFGTVPARIVAISRATVPKEGPAGVVPVYLVTAELGQAWINGFGKRVPLAPGMTLTARIVTDKRSLFEWLFEPVLAVRKR